jgi:hypothetical protein
MEVLDFFNHGRGLVSLLLIGICPLLVHQTYGTAGKSAVHVTLRFAVCWAVPVKRTAHSLWKLHKVP